MICALFGHKCTEPTDLSYNFGGQILFTTVCRRCGVHYDTEAKVGKATRAYISKLREQRDQARADARNAKRELTEVKSNLTDPTRPHEDLRSKSSEGT